jgi:hypothetical protein
MPHLLLRISGNKYVNHTMFRPFLYIYDDLMVYRKRRLGFFVDEITMSYNHIVSVNLHQGIFFSKLEMVLSGGQNMVEIKGVWNKHARKAKKIIDHKIYHVHNKQHGALPTHHATFDTAEKTIGRLKELLHKGKINQKDFDKKKGHLLKDM